MYELIRVGKNTWYVDCPTKIGIYRLQENKVWLIDSGNDRDAGKKLLKIIAEEDWELQGIFNTHSNADHVGGNRLLADRSGCKIVSSRLENMFAEHPFLEPAFLYGGYPCKPLRNKFLQAEPCLPDGGLELLPSELEAFSLPGHYFDMNGIKTPDNIYFLADSMFSEATLAKYHICFIYDVAGFLTTLDMLEELNGELFVPAHAEAVHDIRPLCILNRNKTQEIAENILKFCMQPLDFEQLLQKLFTHYKLLMNFNQYVLVGSTIRSYLSWLFDQHHIKADFVDNRLLWRTI